MPNFLSRTFSSKSKKKAAAPTAAPQQEKKGSAAQPEAPSKFRVLTRPSTATSRPPSSAAPEGPGRFGVSSPGPGRAAGREGVPAKPGSPAGRRLVSGPSSREGNMSRGKTPAATRTTATPSPQPSATGGNHRQRSASDRPVSYVSINTDHSQPLTRPPSQHQSNSTHQNLRASTQSPFRPPQHRAMATRTPQPGAQFRGMSPQDGHYPAHTPRSSVAFDPLASAESFNSNPAVDRYPRPYVTPKNEFTNPTINGLNPKKTFSRSQSMTSEFAATYSLEGAEGFPDSMPSRGTPIPQRRKYGNNLTAQELGRERAASFHDAAASGWDNGVNGRGNGIIPGDRGSGGMGMSSSMPGPDGQVGVGRGMGRRGGPGAPPPVPRIPSSFVKPSSPAIRSSSAHNNDMNNYSQYPPTRNGRSRNNNQSFPGQFSDFDTPPQRVPMPQNRRPPPPQQPYYNQQPQRPPPPPQFSNPNMNGMQSPYHSRPPTRQSHRHGGYPGEEGQDPMPGNSSGEEAYYQEGKNDAQLQQMRPAALPTPALTPTPPSRSNSNEEQQTSDNDSDDHAKQTHERPYDGYYHPQHHSQHHHQHHSQHHHQHPQAMQIQQPRNTAPPSPVSAPRTPPGVDSSSSSSKNSSNYAIAQQIRMSTPIMRGPSGTMSYTKDISLTMEQCMMGHSDIAKDSVMRKTGNWHHSVGCMICGGHGEEGGKPLEDGPASAGKRWLYLCSWCALRVCGECRCKLRDVEEHAQCDGQADGSGAKVRVDLKGFREAVMLEKEKGIQSESDSEMEDQKEAATIEVAPQDTETTQESAVTVVKEVIKSTPPSPRAPSWKEPEESAPLPQIVPNAPETTEAPQSTTEQIQSTPVSIQQKPRQAPVVAPVQSSKEVSHPVEQTKSKYLVPARKPTASRARDSGVILHGGSEDSFLSYATAGTRQESDGSSEGRTTPKSELSKVLENPPTRMSSKAQPQPVEYKAAGHVPTLSGPLNTPKPATKLEGTRTTVTRVEVVQEPPRIDTTPVVNKPTYSAPATPIQAQAPPPPPPVPRLPIQTVTPRPPSIATSQEELDFMRRAVFTFGYPARGDSLPSRPPAETKATKPTDQAFATLLSHSKTLPSVPVEAINSSQDNRRNTSHTPSSSNGGYFLPALNFETAHNHDDYRLEEKHDAGYVDANNASRDAAKKGGKKWYKGLFGGK
ncbi:hypothetical protein DFH27DRAFT_85529 [Peziza echinospora]|nr:hypothetical protein DFH27DRAFT_85529 [Peziza echinospora]